MKYQRANIEANPQLVSCIKPCKIRIWKLDLRYGQTVLLKQHSEHNDERKLLTKKPVCKATKVLQKCTVKQKKCRVHVFNVRRHILKK